MDHTTPHPIALEERLHRERAHARVILSHSETNWGWTTPAGKIRLLRRVNFLTQGLSKNSRVLEIGCGTGWLSQKFQKTISSLEAVDISEDLIYEARRRVPGVIFKAMDAHRLDYPSASFDRILGCSVLHHLDWDRALIELRRVLKPGGEIRFSEPNLLNPQIFLQKNIPFLKARLGDSPDEYAFTATQIRRSIESAGFTMVQVTPFEFLHPATPANWIPRVIALERFLEKSPLRYIGGSLLIRAA